MIMIFDHSNSVQTISGTGANHLGALFLSRFYQWNGSPAVGLSNPTWGTFANPASYTRWPTSSSNIVPTIYLDML